MTNVDNIGRPQVANRAFVPLALEKGAEQIILSIVGQYAMTERDLLIALIERFEGPAPEIAASLNIQTLRAILDAISVSGNAKVLAADNLPPMTDLDGPASVVATRTGGSGLQVEYTEPPTIAGYTVSAEVYVDGVFVRHSTELPANGAVTFTAQFANTGATHELRILYRVVDDAGNVALSRFGQKATFV